MASRVADEREGVVVREAIALAVEIAGKSQIAVQAQKEAVNAGTSYCGPVFFNTALVCVRVRVPCMVYGLAYEQSLSEGLRTERRLFHMTFATEDQSEGA